MLFSSSSKLKFNFLSNNSDGWTRDQKEEYQLVSNILPNVDTIVDVMVTCVVSIEEFYVMMPEIACKYGVTLESLKRNINNPAITCEYRKMNDLPGI